MTTSVLCWPSSSIRRGETATDIIMDGVRARATALGIMRNDKVLPKYLPAIELIKEAFVSKRNTRKGAVKK